MKRMHFIVAAGLVTIGGVRLAIQVGLDADSSESANVVRAANRIVFDLPGIEVTKIHDAADVRLADQDRVIGIVVNGQARA